MCQLCRLYWCHIEIQPLTFDVSIVIMLRCVPPLKLILIFNLIDLNSDLHIVPQYYKTRSGSGTLIFNRIDLSAQTFKLGSRLRQVSLFVGCRFIVWLFVDAVLLYTFLWMKIYCMTFCGCSCLQFHKQAPGRLEQRPLEIRDPSFDNCCVCKSHKCHIFFWIFLKLK